MNEIQDGGVNQQLVRRFNITDVAAPAASMAPEVFPVTIVTPPSPEDAFLRQEILAAAGAFQAAVAGEYTHFKLLNVGLGSGNLVIVDRVILWSDLGAGVYIGATTGTATLANVHPSGCRDTRIAPTTTGRQTHAVLSSETNVGLPFATAGKRMLYVLTLANTPYTVPLDIVLVPGASLDLGLVTANQGLAVSLYWRERRAQPSELG